MTSKELSHQIHRPKQRRYYYAVLVIITLIAIFTALVLPFYTQLATNQPKIGEVASLENVAPHSLTFTSEILTEAQRTAASQSVLPVYTNLDTSVARQQLERLRGALAYISSVRADGYALPEQKVADLTALEDILLDAETAGNILELSDARWQAVQQESIVVLEQVMRSTIREDRLDDAIRSISALVSLSLSEDQSAIVSSLVGGFVIPNSVYSEDLTEEARQKARESVKPVTRSFIQGETILQRGQVVTPLIQEALEQYGLVQPKTRWQDIASAACLSILTIIYFLLYLRRNPSLTHDVRGLTVVFALFLIFLLVGRLITPGSELIPYIYPLSAFGLIITSLFGSKVAMVFSLPLVILFSFDTSNPLELTLYHLLGSYCGILALGAARRVTAFFWAAAAISFAQIAITLSFRLLEPAFNILILASLIGAALINGIASSSLTVLLQYFLAQFLGMTSALQLMENSRPDHPLLQFILRNAPGTYQHSLQVANLAEQAAEKIGADTLLTRVGAIYHDAGKALNPYYFIENQLPGSPNPHEKLDPVESAGVIIRHVADGLELARKYHLPRRIHDFIAEHHGTMTTRYQYVRAVKAAGGDESQVDEGNFSYPGPRPHSRETAILMLADGCEARVRAERPKDETELFELIKNVVENRLTSGQLDETDLTLKDLEGIIESFASTLRGVYHPRLEYPKLERINPLKPDATPTVPIISRKTSDLAVNPEADSS